MELLVQALIDGLTLGLIYSLAALGLSLAFGIMHIINVAHGDLMILGAFMIYWLFYLIGGSGSILTLLALSLGVSTFLGLIGYGFQRCVVNRVIERAPLLSLLLFFGLMLILPNLMIILWGPYARTLIMPELSYTIDLLVVKLSLNRLITLIISVTTIIILMIWVYRTKTGIAIRATAQNREGAIICGVDIKHIYSLVLAVAFFLAGFSGLLLNLNFSFTPVQGVIYTLLTFLIVVLGGMGYPPGTIVSGLLIGLLQAFISTFLGTTFVYAFIFLILYLTLLLRPKGILGRGM